MGTKIFAITNVASPPSPADTGLTLSVTAGHGERFPATPFKAVAVPRNQLPTVDNCEVVTVTDRVGDLFTIVRAQEFTTAKNIEAGWMFFQSVVVDQTSSINQTIELLQIQADDLEAALTAETAARIAAVDTVSDEVETVSDAVDALDVRLTTVESDVDALEISVTELTEATHFSPSDTIAIAMGKF